MTPAEDELARPLTAEDVDYWRKQVADRDVAASQSWRDASVVHLVARWLATLDALRATPVADTAGIDAATKARGYGAPCRSDPVCYLNDGHEGDHLYPTAAALRTPKPEGER